MSIVGLYGFRISQRSKDKQPQMVVIEKEVVLYAFPHCLTLYMGIVSVNIDYIVHPPTRAMISRLTTLIITICQESQFVYSPILLPASPDRFLWLIWMFATRNFSGSRSARFGKLDQSLQLGDRSHAAGGRHHRHFRIAADTSL
jgi:hypothetical protein